MRALALVAVMALVGCECDAPPSERTRSDETTHGDEVAADHGPAVALGDADLAGISDFEVVPLALAERAERARSWSGRGALAGSAGASARRSIGNWLCRLQTHFGAPPEVGEAGFRYALRERESTYVITAFADAGGPALGGVLRDDLRPIDLERMTAIVDRFAALMDATIPDACRLELDGGARMVGVAGGAWFEQRRPSPAE